jgi:hypothetical protein
MKNYTSTVPASRTISRIEEKLVQGGADNITKDYRDGEPVALCFSFTFEEGKKVAIRLPVNVDAVEAVLREKSRKSTYGWEERVSAQAKRTAWKLMQDWIEIQLSLIEMNQAEFLEIFMPYIYNGKTTLYLAYKSQGFMLPEHREGE